MTEDLIFVMEEEEEVREGTYWHLTHLDDSAEVEIRDPHDADDLNKFTMILPAISKNISFLSR